MMNYVIVGGLDWAELTFYAFFLFFLGLVIYLRREDRREGYPLEHDLTGVVQTPDVSILQTAPTKFFKLPFDRGTVAVPNLADRDAMPANVTARGHSGSPFEPLGDPLSSGVGPGSWAHRADRPDVDMHNRPRIVPMRVETHMTVESHDVDLRGLPVTGLDDVIAGTVRDLWVDRAEHVIRYIEVALTAGGTAILPMTMAEVSRRRVHCDAVTAAQFERAPQLASPDQITLLEEDKVQAYFGAGYLWATPARSEPYL